MLDQMLQPLTQALTHAMTRASVCFRAPRHPLCAALATHGTAEFDDVLTPVDDDAEERVSAACGWHDSSWELQCGLAIRECPMERMQRQVPLSWLLEA